MVQVHVPATVWGFESLRWHQEFEFNRGHSFRAGFSFARLGLACLPEAVIR
jgi:hypothetical protein